jgi:hypothetical protein
MNLEYNQLSYFIKQLSIASTHFGVSPQDADTFRNSLNSRFNVRCAPGNPQLLSLCQNPTCPLAVPVSDCAAYVNLTANGVANSSPTSVALSASNTAASSSIGGPTSSTAAAPSSGGSDKLSTGGIAGVAVGGAAIVVVAVIAIFYFLRKRRPRTPRAQEPPHAASWNQQSFSSPPMSHQSGPYPPKDSHVSYLSTGNTPSEIDNSRYQSPVGSPDSRAHHGYGHRGSAQASETWRPAPVEMDTTRESSPPPPHDGSWQNYQQHGDGIPPEQVQRYHGEQQWGRPH